MKNIDLPVDEWDFILVNKILEKLDNKTAATYELSLMGTEIPTYTSLLSFVELHCQAMENISFINKIITVILYYILESRNLNITSSIQNDITQGAKLPDIRIHSQPSTSTL